MAIALEFINFIVPIETIWEKYPGGWDQCLQDHKHLIGGRVWYDAYLFRDGAMSPMDAKTIVEHWSKIGFEPYAQFEGKQTWKDMCLVESMFGGPTLPCSWLKVDTASRSAFLTGTEPGKVIGRESYA